MFTSFKPSQVICMHTILFSSVVSTLTTLTFNTEASSFTIINLLSRKHGQYWMEWLMFMRHALHLVSFPSEGFTQFEHSSFGKTCFPKQFSEPLKNFRWLDPFYSNDNMIYSEINLLIYNKNTLAYRLVLPKVFL